MSTRSRCSPVVQALSVKVLKRGILRLFVSTVAVYLFTHKTISKPVAAFWCRSRFFLVHASSSLQEKCNKARLGGCVRKESPNIVKTQCVRSRVTTTINPYRFHTDISTFHTLTFGKSRKGGHRKNENARYLRFGHIGTDHTPRFWSHLYHAFRYLTCFKLQSKIELFT